MSREDEKHATGREITGALDAQQQALHLLLGAVSPEMDAADLARVREALETAERKISVLAMRFNVHHH